MEKLINFLNSLPVKEQIEFAANCKTTVAYLRKACSKKQKLGAELSSNIEIHSKGEVKRSDLHPTDWQGMWPELAEKKAA